MLSLVREPRIRCWSHIDERCSGFFALGAAKASGRPVAVTCTSGTAAANLAPAVIEAQQARVPMIVLTADRPAELRERRRRARRSTSSSSTATPSSGSSRSASHEATTERLRWMRTLACRAYWTAAQGRPGPVHLNFPLREPLVLDGPLPDDETGRADGRPGCRRAARGAGAGGGAPDAPLPGRARS